MTEPDAASAGRLGQSVSAVLRLYTRTRIQRPTPVPDVEYAVSVLLGPLSEQGPLRSSALAEAVHLDPSRVSRMVSVLVTAGYLERRADPADGRVSILAVTPSGATALVDLRRRRDEYVARVVRDWSETDRRQLAELLDRFAADLAADATADATADAARPEPSPQLETA